MLEDKLKVCGQNNILTEQLERKATPSDDASKEYIMKILKERLINMINSERLKRSLVRMENRLSNIDELEAKLHKAESAISRVEAELEKNMKVVEFRPVSINQKSNGYDISDNASASDVQKTTITKANSDNDVIFDQWNDHKDNEISQVYHPEQSDVESGIFRGFRAAADDRVAFRFSFISKHDVHHIGERINFSSVDYNEGGIYDKAFRQQKASTGKQEI